LFVGGWWVVCGWFWFVGLLVEGFFLWGLGKPGTEIVFVTRGKTAKVQVRIGRGCVPAPARAATLKNFAIADGGDKHQGPQVGRAG